MSVTSTFNAIVGDIDYAMFIVTASVEGERTGCLVGFATQTSIHPSRFLVCLSHKNHTYRHARRAQMLAVHVVPAEATELAELFGGETGDEIDKFERCGWQPGPEGVPILADCPDWFVGRVVAHLDAGDHDAFLLEPVDAHRGTDAEDELTFQRARWIDPGHPA
jgi:flavin reductase (DIM6/NTAB) family NADH-FMN oxidoreductase RutF